MDMPRSTGLWRLMFRVLYVYLCCVYEGFVVQGSMHKDVLQGTDHNIYSSGTPDIGKSEEDAIVWEYEEDMLRGSLFLGCY